MVAAEIQYKNMAADKQRRVNEARRRMPKEMQQYIKRLEGKYTKLAKPIAAERDKKTAVLQKEVDGHQQVLNGITQELNQARQMVSNAPIDAALDDLVKWQVIADKWPARQGEINGKIHELRQQTNEIERKATSELRNLQKMFDVDVQHARRDLDAVADAVNIHKLAQ